ncbi:PTS sugar transporter subunit IIB, partial [Enterobacter hormaechei]|uniref:PTS sugar transporter subunit IIB n=1 Tax=Enterobacter hormaechei TaxID=158836 RepID=UPI003D700A64
MSISFVRIDDRVIHGQLITRWARELPWGRRGGHLPGGAGAPRVLGGGLRGGSDTKLWVLDEGPPPG